jgi:predicted flap endonuclease-1-like 5' DNA nuclease
MNITDILIPALVGVVCGILGYAKGKMNFKQAHSLATSLQEDLDVCKANTRNLGVKIASLESEIASKSKLKTASSHSIIESETIILFDSNLSEHTLKKKIKENDLKIVEGIGPKIEALFQAAGITTWRDLSIAQTDKLQAILNSGGEHYAMHNPRTWARQALMAYQGKWQELKDWQEGLRGGKE